MLTELLTTKLVQGCYNPFEDGDTLKTHLCYCRCAEKVTLIGRRISRV